MKLNDQMITRDELLAGKRPGQRTTILAPKGDDPVDAQQEQIYFREQQRRLDLAAVRERLQGKEGDAFWQSLEELTEDPEFTELMTKEFPRMAPHFSEVDRRGFLKLMGASLAMAGMTACTRQPTERIVPYVRAPEEFVPGKSSYFATSMPHAGYAMGLLAESHMGRPIKVEGNPDHPASLGATNALAQASILGMYDPERSQSVKHAGIASTWDDFKNALSAQLAAQANTQGAGLRILTETITSPSQAAMIKAVKDRFPQAEWVSYEPLNRDTVREGSEIAFGRVVDTLYDFTLADVVVAFDADFMGEGPASVRYARDFASRRDVATPGVRMNRLYMAESVPSVSGVLADHRLPVRASDVEAMVRALARAFGVDAPGPELSADQAEWIDAVAADCRANPGAVALVAGDRQPAAVHALIHAIHDVLGVSGKTVRHIEPVDASPGLQGPAFKKLTDDMEQGAVQVLLILDANPALNAPADLAFLDKLANVPFVAHLGLYDDETAVASHWHVPIAHFLEGWGDARAFDGTVSLIQPLIEPLYAGRTMQEVLAICVDRADESAYDLVKSYWSTQGWAGDFDRSWRKALHDGLVEESASPPVSVTASRSFPAPSESVSGLEVIFTKDDSVWDGRYTNNAWLQELPRPMSKLTWDNALLMAPATAESLGVANGDVVEVSVNGASVEGPVWIQPGHGPDCVSVQLGYGRRQSGSVALGAGFDVYPLRSSSEPWIAGEVSIRATGRSQTMASTQRHHQMHGLKDRKLVRVASLEQFMANPGFAHVGVHDPAEDDTMFPPYDYSQGYQWGMTVNLNTCIGCNVCMVACQSENNIPVVGKDNAAMGRTMHWIRIDRYYAGDLDAPDVHVQPLTCMHCELAPCEPVCPVGATVHSADGLNQMVYNRCVGTRYCANNCPYKVRRFNFFQYADETTPQLKLMRNPNVTVRTRGVMEKCTFCIQRISKARIKAERDHTKIADADLKTACQQACPTQAITFGDINNPDSEVSRRKATPLNYALLGELNVRPRTTYLAKVKNTNPALAGGGVA